MCKGLVVVEISFRGGIAFYIHLLELRSLNVQVLREKLLQPVKFLSVASIVISATLGMASIASGFMGYLIHDLKWYSRIALVAGGLLMVIPGTVTDLAGLAILIVILLIQKAENKKEKKAAV